MSKDMDEIIYESQTAYIPGRYLHDNLRSLQLIKQLRKIKNNGILVGVDAKKRF
jgi:hypothetical protein